MDQLGKVCRPRTMNSVKAHACNFVLDSCFNREPVQRVKVRGHVISSGNFENKACGRILNFLKTVDKIMRAVYKKTIVIVKA